MQYNGIRELRLALERKKGLRDQLLGLLEESGRKLALKRQEQSYIQVAQSIIQAVAQRTQEELKYHIEDLVSLALAAVFDEPYRLRLDFVIKRGRTEAEIWFERDGERAHPLTASGGGAVDVAGFALRVALWSLSLPRSRAVFVLDEPFKHLSADLQPRAGQMLREVSQRLGLQVIMVSHVSDLVEAADRVFEIRLKGGESFVKVI